MVFYPQISVGDGPIEGIEKVSSFFGSVVWGLKNIWWVKSSMFLASEYIKKEKKLGCIKIISLLFHQLTIQPKLHLKSSNLTTFQNSPPCFVVIKRKTSQS